MTYSEGLVKSTGNHSITGWDHTIRRLYPYLDHVMTELEIRHEWVTHIIPANIIMTSRIGNVDSLVLPITYLDTIPRDSELKDAQYLPETSTILFAVRDNNTRETYTRSRILFALVYELRRVWQYYYAPEFYYSKWRGKNDADQYAKSIMDSWVEDVDLI